MTTNSKIEWTDHTFNPWEGCQKVGPGCDHCYAEARNARFGGGVAVNWGPGAPRRRTSRANWNKPLQWNRQHEEFFAAHGRRQRVFCASLADVFDNEVSAQWRFDLLKLIEQTPNLDWLLLTKRIGNVAPMLEQAVRAINCGRCGWADNVFPNVWIGATIVNQEEADRDIPKLLDVPAAVRFLSMEPLLSPVDLRQIGADKPMVIDALRGEMRSTAPISIDPSPVEKFKPLDWVIVGGESGSKARPMHPDWVRDLRDQCEAASVPFLFKQWGEWAPGECASNTLEMRSIQIARWFGDEWAVNTIAGNSEFHRDDEPDLYRAGKKASGRLLDGVQHDGFPEVT